jgi:chromosome segregation ATPase
VTDNQRSEKKEHTVTARIVKCMLGASTVLVGILGVVFSVFAIVEGWRTAVQFRREMPKAIDQLEAVVVSVHRQGEMAVDALQRARNGLGSIHVTVEELAKDGKNGQHSSILPTLDAELERMEEFVRSVQASLHGASNTLLMLESIPFLRPRQSASAEEDTHLKNLAVSLTAISDRLEQVATIVAEIRSERRVQPRQVAHLKNALGRVDNQLAQFQGDVEKFSTEVNTLAVRLSETKESSPTWIRQAAVLGALFFICFGFSQVVMLLHGWRVVRATSRLASESTPQQRPQDHPPPA